VALGDKMSGFVAEQVVKSATDILHGCRKRSRIFTQGSDYALSLGPDVIKRAANRVFRAPKPRFAP